MSRKDILRLRYGMRGRETEHSYEHIWENQLIYSRGGTSGKEPTSSAGDMTDAARSLGREDALEEGVATHSSILSWRTPWTGEPGGLQPIGYKESDMTEVTWHAHAEDLLKPSLKIYHDQSAGD